MRKIKAGDPGTTTIKVFLNGKEVSDRCNRCLIPNRPGRWGLGWVDLLTICEDEWSDWVSSVIMDEDGEPIVHRRYGFVKWEYDKELLDQLERNEW